MRKFVGRRRSSALLALGIAYVLAIQTLLASVGFGMSVAAQSSPGGLILCAHVADVPAAPGDRKGPAQQPQCIFCFLAGQSSVNVAAVSGAPALPAYVGFSNAAELAADSPDRPFVPLFRRTVGDPRAPPSFSV